jgi:hypothetical protein
VFLATALLMALGALYNWLMRARYEKAEIASADGAA